MKGKYLVKVMLAVKARNTCPNYVIIKMLNMLRSCWPFTHFPALAPCNWVEMMSSSRGLSWPIAPVWPIYNKVLEKAVGDCSLCCSNCSTYCRIPSCCQSSNTWAIGKCNKDRKQKKENILFWNKKHCCFKKFFQSKLIKFWCGLAPPTP